MSSNLKGVRPAKKPRTGTETLFLLSMLGLGVVAAGVAATSLLWPLSWDEGIFAWIGGVMNRGGTPYTDAWDVKGPIAYFGYGAATALFGANAHGARLLDLLLTMSGTVAVYRLLVPLTGQRSALAGALLLFISVLGQGYNVNGQPDLWAGWCLVFIVVVLRVPMTVFRTAVAAMLLGIAVLIKPTYAAMGLLLLVPILHDARSQAGATRYRFTLDVRGGWRRYLSHIFAIAAGIALPVGLCAAWFWSRGALPEFWSAYIMFNVESGGANQRTLAGISNGITSFLVSHRAVLVALPAVFVGLLGGERLGGTPVPSWKTRVLATWILTLLGLVILQNRWFSYHWAPLYAPLAVAATVGFHRIVVWNNNATAARFTKLAAFAALALIAAGASIAPVKQILRASQLALHRITVDEYFEAFDDYPGVLTARDVRLAARYVKANTQPNDVVFVWEDPNVNVLSGRPTSGRFAFWTPILPPTGNALTPRYEANQTEFFKSLELRPPVLLLMERAAWRGGNLNTIANVEAKFPAFMHWIEQRYVLKDSAGVFLVFAPR